MKIKLFVILMAISIHIFALKIDQKSLIKNIHIEHNSLKYLAVGPNSFISQWPYKKDAEDLDFYTLNYYFKHASQPLVQYQSHQLYRPFDYAISANEQPIYQAQISEHFADNTVSQPLIIDQNIQSNLTYHISIFSHVAQDDQWWTGVAIVNPSSFDTEVIWEALDSSGNIIGISNLNTLKAGEKTVGVLTQWFGSAILQNTAWMRLKTTQKVISFEIFGNTDFTIMTGIPANHEAYIHASIPLNKPQNNGYSAISLINIESLSSDIILSGYNSLGQLLANKTLEIPPASKVVGLIDQLFADQWNPDISNILWEFRAVYHWVSIDRYHVLGWDEWLKSTCSSIGSIYSNG